MEDNPKIHHRKSIRLKGYDYSQAGAYFITICCQDRECRFGKIVVGAPLADAQHGDAPTMELNEFGQIAYNEWAKLQERFTNFELDVFQIMPNHVHGIIVLNKSIANVGAGFTPAQNDGDTDNRVRINRNPAQNDGADNRVRVNRTPTVGDIVGAYKSLVANACLKIYKSKNKTMGKLWQRNFHEHIIRNEQSYQIISGYIINNPAKWNDDKFFKE